MTALARASSNCKRQTRPHVRETGPHQQTRNCLTVIRIAQDGSLTPRQTGRLTVGRNIILTLSLTLTSNRTCGLVVKRDVTVYYIDVDGECSFMALSKGGLYTVDQHGRNANCLTTSGGGRPSGLSSGTRSPTVGQPGVSSAQGALFCFVTVG
jgi:hypothetical protein